MSLWECTEGDKEWVPLPRRQAHGCAMDVLRSLGQRHRHLSGWWCRVEKASRVRGVEKPADEEPSW